MQRVLAFPPPRGIGDQREFISKRMCFAFMFALGFLAFLGGFLLGRFVFDKELELSRLKYKEVYRSREKGLGVFKNYSRFNVSSIIEGISESSIQQYLGLLTNQSTEDSASKGLREAEILRNHLTSHGFDLVSPLAESQIQMSYPSSRFPNEVLIINGEGVTVFNCNDSRAKYSGSVGRLNTTAVEGSVLYVNFGRDEDYQYLDSLGINYNNKIFLLRGGEITTTEIVTNAVEHGAKGIIIFSDFDPTDVQLPLITPADLAKLQIRYGNLIDKWAGTIPILEISPTDAIELFNIFGVDFFSTSLNTIMKPKAQRFLNFLIHSTFRIMCDITDKTDYQNQKVHRRMSSRQTTPNSWKGKQKVGYRIGPGFHDKTWMLKMKVSTVNIVETVYTTLGAMRGTQEPDRFLLLTNEKSLNDNEEKSTSVIMEVVRVLGELKTKGWRPHRSIVVAFWGEEGPNLHLSSHPESILTQIMRKTVAYFDVDSNDPTGGNQSLASVTPMLEKLFYESAMTVPLNNPSADILPSLATDNLFIQCGIPFIKMKQFGLSTLKDVATFWGVMTWRMIESHKLPFSLSSYAEFFAHSVNIMEERFKTTAKEHSLLLDSLFQSVHRLIEVIKSFEDNWSRADPSKSLEMRVMSDQLLDFTRFLLCGSDSTQTNQSTGDFIFSKSLTGTDDRAGFGELQDLLQDVMTAKHPEEFQNQVIAHLASLVEAINLSRESLSDGLETLIMANT